MIRALYTAASAMLFGMRQQDIAADNLANTRTAGYKAVTSAGEAFSGVLARNIDSGAAPVPVPQELESVIGLIGTGVWQSVRGNDFTDGAMRTTQDPLDVAVSGVGFFAVQTADGVNYTRNGHLKRSLDNILITQEGLPVLDEAGNTITLDTDNVRVKTNGEILIGEETVAKLGVYDLPAETALRAGANRFAAPPDVFPAPVALGTDTTIQQGMLEEANVNAAKVASQVLSTGRNFEASQHVFSTISATLEAAVLQIGKV